MWIVLFALALIGCGDDANSSQAYGEALDAGVVDSAVEVALDVAQEVTPEASAPVCEPGKQDACACAGGYPGAQACKSDGSGWQACACPDASVLDATKDTSPIVQDVQAEVIADAQPDTQPDVVDAGPELINCGNWSCRKTVECKSDTFTIPFPGCCGYGDCGAYDNDSGVMPSANACPAVELMAKKWSIGEKFNCGSSKPIL